MRRMFPQSRLSARHAIGILFFLLMAETAVRPAADEPKAPRPWIEVREPALGESSGLGASRREPNRFWSHNDSGGLPQLFAFDGAGNTTGRCRLVSAKANDWEDMACYRHDGVARILVADCGDNPRSRSNVKLYLFDEPDPNQVAEIRDHDTMIVQYPDGPHDCEAVGVDVARGKIIMITKTALPLAGIYTIDLPPLRSSNPALRHDEVSAKRIGTLPLPMVSAMDIDSSSGDIWVVNYFQAFRFSAAERNASIASQLAGIPIPVPLPKLRQVEAVAADEHHDIWLTSEGSPTRFAKLNQ